METHRSHPNSADIDPLELIIPGRKIQGTCALLLPFRDNSIDWTSFQRLLERILEYGLVPAINMDTGHVTCIDQDQRLRVLELATGIVAGGPFVGGVIAADPHKPEFNLDEHCAMADQIIQRGGTPILFQSRGLTTGSDEDCLRRYEEFAKRIGKFIAFELSPQFASFGKIYSLDLFQSLIRIPECVGLKHSSLDRMMEWQRLAIRNRTRPDFRIYTGNDLAIDMVMYGSDYLLGLATFAPDLFAYRDQCWAGGDPDFYRVNDGLQSLGSFAFRDPIPAYRHSAAQFLKGRGWIETDHVPASAATRPESDIAVLKTIADRMQIPWRE